MAVRIPIITVFDSKGLKAAQYQLNKVRGNFAALGRNAAIATAAIGGVTVALGKAVTAASNLEAEFEGVNQVFGTAAGSVQAFAKQAATSAGITETAALQASKVFGLFATGAGLTEKEAATFSTTMVQLAGDLGSFNDVPTAEALAAIQSGLQGQSEPLRKFGVFLDDARLKAEALNLGIYDGKGPLSQQQKMMAAYESILKQTNIQQGDFVKYADTYGNQLKTLQSEFSNLSAEVGQTLLPVMAEIIPVIREVVTQLGPKLKDAIASVDWAGLATSLGTILTYLVQNLETILKVVGAMWALNTIYNTVKVTIGIANGIIALTNVLLGGTTAAAGFATGALTLLRGALLLSGIGAVILALGFVVTGIMNGGKAATDATPQLTNYGGALRKSGQDAEWAAAKYGIATTAAQNLGAAAANLPIPGRTAATSRPSRGGTRARPAVVVPNVSSQMKKTNSALDAAAKKAKAAAAKKKAAAKAAAAEEAAAAAAAAAARAAALQKEKDQYKSFGDSVASTFAGIKDKILDAFSLPELGGSTNSIIRNMGKLLAKTRDFSKNITQLSAMGLNPALLQQVISSGPVAGAQLAASLVAGGAAGLSTINAGYAELGSLASDIGMTGTQSLFGTQAQQNIYNINVRGGLDRAPDIGKAIVDAIKAYERTSGAVWQVA
jgi:hypothetical protein